MTTFNVYSDRATPSPATPERHQWLGRVRDLATDLRSTTGRVMEACLASFRQLGRSAVDGWTGQAQVEAPAVRLPVIRFTRERFGRWTVVGTDDQPRTGFTDIEDAVAYARRSCDAAPATLWLDIDGLVVVTTQDSGWTRPLIGAKT
jgi:hypothetical protein